MGLFKSFFKDKDLERLEKAVKDRPSPDTFAALIKKYWELGDAENSLLIAQQAIEKFPSSEQTFELYAKIKKSQVQNEIENLKSIIKRSPNPAAFAQLAEIYKDLREEETALRYCQEAIEIFPNDDSPYLIIGEIRLMRFYKDFLIKDARIALENLEKSFEINSKNYKALLALAKFYLQIGAITKARQRLKSILLFAPEDENVKELLDISSKVSKPSHEDIDILLQTIEEDRKLYYSLYKGKDSPIISPEVFQKPLENLRNINFIQCFLVCDEEGNLVAQYALDQIDTNTYYEVAASIYQVLQETSPQMDVGRFQRGQIETKTGNIQIVIYERVVYIAFGDKSVKAEQLYKEIQKIITKVSY